MKTRNISRLRLVLSVLVLSALAIGLKLSLSLHASAQQEDGNRMAARTPTAPTQPVKTLDDMFADVARLVPTFGGFFVGDDGRLNVYLLDRSQLPTAMQAIIAVFGREGLPLENPVAVQGRYSFTQLKAWHDAHQRTTLAMADVSFTDIDERNNCLEIGVTSFNALLEVRQALIRMGISEEAAHISEVEPIKMTQDLQSKWRPIAGGIQTGNLGGNCTLSFLAIAGKNAGFITPSHCTSTFGMNNGDAVKQPDNNIANRIGTELYDPPLFTNNGCPSGRLCRYSDAAFISRDAAAVQPTPLITGDFSYLLLANASKQEVPVKYHITSRANFSVAGSWVEKVGITTGRTKGQITATCANTTQGGLNGGDSGRTLFCQNFVAAATAPGDSGAPVFNLESWPGGSTGVRLHGVLWGGTSQYFIYSPLAQIDAEMQYAGAGKLKVYHGDFPSSIPMVKIRQPLNNSTVQLGGDTGVSLEAEAVDYEDTDLQFAWTSNVDGVLGYGKKVPFVFTTSGPRTVTVTATDDEGNAKTDSITLNVAANTPPKMTITNLAANQQLYTGVFYSFTGTSYDPNEVNTQIPCANMAWSSKKVGALNPVALGTGCSVPAKFLNAGDYAITLKGTDSNGGTGSVTVTIKLVAPPASGPPVVTMLSPVGNELWFGDVPATLKAVATDPDGKNPLTYQWAVDDGQTYKVIKTGTANNGQQFSFSWTPNQSLPHSCKSYSVKVWLTVTDADGEKTPMLRIVTINYGPC
ncbi:MAG: hypothetical protein KA368_03085 [Acidobacteria bacterium]|nr:hypothetical protein [Acidobacteriota bacterium]